LLLRGASGSSDSIIDRSVAGCIASCWCGYNRISRAISIHCVGSGLSYLVFAALGLATGSHGGAIRGSHGSGHRSPEFSGALLLRGASGSVDSIIDRSVAG
jgi:hypothetical protein